jgi:hypothetical protein
MTDAVTGPVATLMDRSIAGTWHYRLFTDRLEVQCDQLFTGSQTLQFTLSSLAPVHGVGRLRLPPFWTGLWITMGSILGYVAVAWLQGIFSRAPFHPALWALFATLTVTGVLIMLLHRRVVSAVYFAFEAGPQAVSFTSNGQGEASFAAFVTALRTGIEHARLRGPTMRIWTPPSRTNSRR